MKCLTIVRHAKSDWGDPRLPDEARPLNARGERDAPRMAEHLSAQGIPVELLLHSSAMRAASTADAFAVAYPGAERRADPGLYLASVERWLARLRELDEDLEAVLVVGHNPGLHELLATLSPASAPRRLPTCAVAVLDLSVGRWADLDAGCGALRELWLPRELG